MYEIKEILVNLIRAKYLTGLVTKERKHGPRKGQLITLHCFKFRPPNKDDISVKLTLKVDNYPSR